MHFSPRALSGAFAVLALGFAARASAQTEAQPIRIAVDLRQAPKRIFHARMEFPVTPGPLTLAYPKWIPGEHGPTGPITDVTGLHFRAGAREIPWRRDDVDMYAFHCEIPAGADTLEVSLDYLSPGSEEFAASPAATAQLAVLTWNRTLLYPLGKPGDDIFFAASLRLPSGWKYGTALPVAQETTDGIEFKPVSLTLLVDSPVIAGAYLRTIDLTPGQTPGHRIHLAADGKAAIQMTPEQINNLRQLIAETGALFGARHYRHYDFLLALSDFVSPDGLEHHESSDNRVPERSLIDSDLFEMQTDLLPHEFFHSWNGKYRRPAGILTAEYQQPMRGDLLWVYEGLTSYYGNVLAARSGFWTPEKFREHLAGAAAYLDQRAGRTWRDLEDTAVAAQLLYRARPQGASWRRGVDFYDESALIWLEADTILRRETKGKRSLDDFCRRFHGGQNTPPKVVPYSFEDVAAAMNDVAPYDWRRFFTERLHSHGPGAPLGGLEASGWTLVFTDKMNEHQRSREEANHLTDVQFSLGFLVHTPGSEGSDQITDVIPGSAAAKAGLAPGMRLLAVNGRRWTPEILRDAIQAAKGKPEPIELLVENEDYFQTYRVDYHGGERYPHLERVASQPDLLTDILKALAPGAARSN